MRFKIRLPGFGYSSQPVIKSLPTTTERTTWQPAHTNRPSVDITQYVEINTLQDLMKLVDEFDTIAISGRSIIVDIERIY